MNKSYCCTTTAIALLGTGPIAALQGLDPQILNGLVEVDAARGLAKGR